MGQTTRETVRKMLEAGHPVRVIALSTGVTTQRVYAIIKSLKAEAEQTEGAA